MLSKERNQRIKYFSELLKDLTNASEYDFNTSNKSVLTKPGVYIIFNRHDRCILYLGETNNLRRRLFTNHKSGNIKASAFRKALSKKLNTIDEFIISKFIVDNCKFKFISIDTERRRFESFATAILDPELNPKEIDYTSGK